MLHATGSQAVLRQQIEDALKEDEENYQTLTADQERLADAREGQRASFVNEFVSLFGGPPGQSQGDFQASLPQALFLANNETVVKWVEPNQGNLSEQLMLVDDAKQLAEQVYLSVLSRFPDEEERAQVQSHMDSRGGDRRLAIVELVWSLVASAEFRLNY
jgi:hypothetical protein